MHLPKIALFLKNVFYDHYCAKVADNDDAKLLVINVYIPLASSVPGQTPDLTSIFNITRDVRIVGVFNAHYPRWHSHTQDTAAERR